MLGEVLSRLYAWCTVSCVKLESVPRRSYASVCTYAKLVQIYDGDTFTIITRLHPSEPYASYQLRLAGLDAPELKPNYKTPDRELHKKAGFHVRDELRTVFPIGSVLWIEFDKEEKYGRLLGTVWYNPKWWEFWRSGININQWLLEHDFAVPYDGKRKYVFTTHHLKSILSSNQK